MMKEWQHKGAFVIQFHDDTDMAAGRFSGRVEHIESSRFTHFHSLEELLSFLNHVLKEVSANNQKES